MGLGCYVPGSLMLSLSGIGKKEINMAELAAIYMGLLCRPSRNIEVFTDSATALEVLSGRVYKKKYQPLVDCIHHVSNTMYDSVKYTKVKAHSGNPGNEVADILARKGTIENQGFVLPIDNESIEANIYKNEFIHDRILFF
jgi:ribonuclease HI